jgi:hypothetical protein
MLVLKFFRHEDFAARSGIDDELTGDARAPPKSRVGEVVARCGAARLLVRFPQAYKRFK